MTLTHTILNEQSLQQELQNFNYEVFVSKTMLDMLLDEYDPWDTFFYQLVILSESLSNKELKAIVPQLKQKNTVIFRKYVCELSNEEKVLLNELKIDQWFLRDIGTDALRELISDATSPIIDKAKDKQLTNNIEGLIIDFTKNQKKYFLKLYEEQQSIVSREELSQSIWNDDPNQSNMSQLSVLTKSIRQKLMNKGFPPNSIETVWGKGYLLTSEFYTTYRKIYQ